MPVFDQSQVKFIYTPFAFKQSLFIFIYLHEFHENLSSGIDNQNIYYLDWLKLLFCFTYHHVVLEIQ